jgi:tetratricopeptide (TPR) repeat protein
MYEQGDGPILESRHHEGLQPKRNSGVVIAIMVGVVSILIAGGALFFVYEQQAQEEYIVEELQQDWTLDTAVTEINQDEGAKEPIIKEELGTLDFFYKRALQREGDKDYNGAVEDYTKTIGMAKKYSAEMWNSLNNRGIIKAQQLKDYRGAKKDFDKIISIETNRYDGEINATRLEAGYTNRAYVKIKLGDKESACDDLYEALSLGVESSVSFIEKQIDKNCL